MSSGSTGIWWYAFTRSSLLKIVAPWREAVKSCKWDGITVRSSAGDALLCDRRKITENGCKLVGWLVRLQGGAQRGVWGCYTLNAKSIQELVVFDVHQQTEIV